MATRKSELVLTCNATAIKDVMEFLNQKMNDLIKKRDELNARGAKDGWTKEMEKEFKNLGDDIAAITSMQQKNREEMMKYAQVMENLSNAKLRDLKSAAAEASRALNKMTENNPNRRKLIEDIEKIKRKIKEVQTVTLSEAEITDRVNNRKKYNIVQLQQAYDQLKAKLSNIAVGETEAIEKTQKQMKSLQKEISTAKGELTGFAKLWNTALKNIGAYMGVFAAFGYVKNKIMEVTKGSIALSDAMAQVQKVTGLSKQEVDELNKSFAKLDTRTTITQLNDLAFSAGKMGLGKYGLEGIEGFVKATNQLQVALGDDLGNSVEEAITPLAKLAENMGLIQKMGVEKSMMAIGSSINELSQTTTAAGRNIVDFTRRIQPTAQMLGLTVDQVLALGSASDAFGISAEVSATAFTKFLSSYRTNTDAIEQALGIAKGTLDEFYNKGQTIEGLMLIFQRMHDIGDIRVLAPIFKELGSEGSKMFETFGSFSKNIDQLRDHVLTSELAFEEATSVTREYNLVQDTAAGILERANNIWEKAFVNPEGVDMVKQLTIEWYNLSKELTNSATWIDFVQGLMKRMVFVVETLIKLLPTLVRAMFFYGVAQAVRNIYIQFTMLNTAMATATTTAGKLSAFMKSNLWVLAGTAIMFATSAIYDMATASSKAKKEADAMGDALKKASDEGEKASAKERAELKRLYDATQDQKKAIEERTKAALELKRKYPDYFSDLTTEQILAGKAADAYQNLAQQILNAAKARAMEKKIEQLQEENISLEDDNRKREQWRDDNQKKYEEEKAKIDRAVDQQNRMETAGASPVGGKMGYVHATNAGDKQLIGQYQANDQAIDNNSKKMDENTKTMERLSDAVSKIKPATTTSPNMPTFTPGSGGDDDNDKKGGGARKAAQERKQALRKEMEDAQKASTGIISKLEEYYRLQEAAINDARADGQLTEEQAKEMVRALSIVKNESLATARRAVTTGETKDWDELKTKVLPAVMSDTSEVSRNLLSTIQQVAVDKLHADLEKFNGGKDVMGLDSRAFFDQMNAKAAGNTREAARLRAAITNEVEKALKQYHFVELAQDKMRKDLETMGFMTETYEQWAKRMQEGIKEKPDTQLPNGGTISDKDAYNKMGQKFVVQRDIAYRINIENEREALEWLQQFSKDAEGNMEDWTYAFPELQRWLDLIKTRDESLRKDDIVGARQAEKAIEESMPAIQQFYGNLMQYEGAYYDALKKRDDLQNKRLDSWWEHSDQKKENDRKLRDIQLYDFQYNTMHEGETMGFMMGLTNDLTHDPEVMREQAVLEAKIAIWQKAKEEREANLISEEVYQQKLRDMQDQTMAYSQKVMDNINKRISRIQAFVKPVETAANTIGKKLGDMIFNMQSEESTWEQIWKNMALAMAESLLTMVGQYAQYQIQKSAINKSEVLDEAGKAQAITMLNISSGAAKTIGTLGWWGIALIPVITSLLMGLLTSALSTVNSSESGTSTSTPKTKLVSGMLTYDKGNVDKFAGRRKLYDDGETQVYGRRRYLGEDGKVYTATAEPAPKDGLVTHPIATTVQGQPALVAENGPEIVIGRETTKAIMMNEPQLIKYLADYGKTGGFAGGYPTARGLAAFDGGNINGQWSMVNGQLSPDDARALVAAITTFNQTVQQMQQKGIPCYINKYGRGGLIDEVKSGMKFMSKYEG